MASDKLVPHQYNLRSRSSSSQHQLLGADVPLARYNLRPRPLSTQFRPRDSNSPLALPNYEQAMPLPKGHRRAVSKSSKLSESSVESKKRKQKKNTARVQQAKTLAQAEPREASSVENDEVAHFPHQWTALTPTDFDFDYSVLEEILSINKRNARHAAALRLALTRVAADLEWKDIQQRRQLAELCRSKTQHKWLPSPDYDYRPSPLLQNIPIYWKPRSPISALRTRARSISTSKPGSAGVKSGGRSLGR